MEIVLSSVLPQPSSLSILSSFSSTITAPLSFSILSDNNESFHSYPHFAPLAAEKLANSTSCNWNDFTPPTETPKPLTLSVTPISSLFVNSPRTASICVLPQSSSLRVKSSDAQTLPTPDEEKTRHITMIDDNSNFHDLNPTQAIASALSKNPTNSNSLHVLSSFTNIGTKQPTYHASNSSMASLVMPPSLRTATLPFIQSNLSDSVKIDKHAMKGLQSNGTSGSGAGGSVGGSTENATGSVSHRSVPSNTRMSLDVSIDNTPSNYHTNSGHLPASSLTHPYTHFNQTPAAHQEESYFAPNLPSTSITINASSENKSTLLPPQSRASEQAASVPFHYSSPMTKTNTVIQAQTASNCVPDLASPQPERRTSKRKLAAISNSNSKPNIDTKTTAPVQKSQKCRPSSCSGSASTSSGSSRPRQTRKSRISTPASRSSSPTSSKPSSSSKSSNSSVSVRPRMRMINGRLRPPILSPARLASHRRYDAKRRKIFQYAFGSLRSALASGQTTVKQISEDRKNGLIKKKKYGKKKEKEGERRKAAEAKVNNYSIAELLLESANTIRMLTQLKEEIGQEVQAFSNDYENENEEQVNDKKKKKKCKKEKVKEENENDGTTIKMEECLCVADLETLKNVIKFVFQEDDEDNDDQEEEEEDEGEENEDEEDDDNEDKNREMSDDDSYDKDNDTDDDTNLETDKHRMDEDEDPYEDHDYETVHEYVHEENVLEQDDDPSTFQYNAKQEFFDC